MDTLSIAVIIGAIGILWFIVATLMIFGSLQKRGLPVSFVWLRMMAPKYASQYRDITRSETGHTGQLFYHWIISINIALVCAIIALIASL